jgi:hypothetical protein
MSDVENPWQSPRNAAVPEPQTGGAALNDTMLRSLREAAPWLRFIGILGYICCALMAAVGLIGGIMMLAVSGLAEEFASLPGGFGGATAGAFALLYVVMGGVYFFPARFAYTFGDKIRCYLLSNNERDLETAFKNNKSLWKFYGILCIICLAFLPLVIIGGIVAALGAAFM